jgi:hypothetical protein
MSTHRSIFILTGASKRRFGALATIIDSVRQGRGPVIEKLERRFFGDCLAEDQTTRSHTEQEIARLVQFAHRCCPWRRDPRSEVIPFYKVTKERENRMIDRRNLQNQMVEIWQEFEELRNHPEPSRFLRLFTNPRSRFALAMELHNGFQSFSAECGRASKSDIQQRSFAKFVHINKVRY